MEIPGGKGTYQVSRYQPVRSSKTPVGSPWGDYIVGKKDLIGQAAYMYCTQAGQGVEPPSVSPVHSYKVFSWHLMWWQAIGSSIRLRIFQELGFGIAGAWGWKKHIIQSIKFRSEEQLLSFCRGIQRAPVDSFVTPYPWDMPSYGHQVIMAAGAFVQGSSKAKHRAHKEPYYGYLQGDLPGTIKAGCPDNPAANEEEVFIAGIGRIKSGGVEGPAYGTA